ncbi:putative monooxygenase [Hyaloraphidium curvatum]|nr:putative monooxygenase [Hyaloraphidium curvatum]
MELPAELLSQLDFDPVALRKKYDEERDKRLRPDGNEQWILTDGDLAKYRDDPHTKPKPRAAVDEECEVALLGGGFGTLVVGSKLTKAGVTGIRVIEEGGGFGGTWYWNRYPNAKCDTESYVYLPLLEESGFMPSTKYPAQNEILAHCESLAKRFGLYDNALLSTHVTSMEWDDVEKRWHIRTDRGDHLRARTVVVSVGNLTRAKLPGIEGIRRFKGQSFHTSRWDYSITGGDSTGNLTKLKDKVVGIIGTGATAIQCIPALGEHAKHLYVFQRTPSAVDRRGEKKTDLDWWKEMTSKPGWQRRRIESFSNVTSGIEDEDLVNDGWGAVMRKMTTVKQRFAGMKIKVADMLQLADMEHMNSIRKLVDEVVQDKETAEKLKPYFGFWCKRPCFSDTYLQTFNRANVTLVDTDGKGVQGLTEDGVVANGKEYKVDLLIFATGFEYGAISPGTWEHRLGIKCTGRNGISLTQKWKDGASTFHGMTIRDFPSLFFMSSVQSALPFNWHHLLFELSDYIVYCVKQYKERGILSMEPTQEAEGRYTDLIVKLASLRRSFFESCIPGYYNGEGQVFRRQARNLQYGAGQNAYFSLIRNWALEDKLEGMDIVYAPKASL